MLDLASIKRTDKQWEYLKKANCRWNLKIGAVRSGKSFGDVCDVIRDRMLASSGLDGLTAFFGVSISTIERNILQPMRELYGGDIIGQINSSQGVAQVFFQKVYCIGMEKVSAVGKIQGMSLKYAYGDEVAKWNAEAFRILESRLDKPYSVFDGTCNPESPNHWMKGWLETPGLDAYMQHYQIDDNPTLPASFVESLKAEYAGTVYYDRYILGRWALAEGLIYPMYQEAVEEPPDTEPEAYALSIDYGTQNPFAAALWEKHGGTWYAAREYYYSGRDTQRQKTDEEYAADMDGFISDIMEKREAGGGSLRKMETIIDPSAASFITLLRKRRWYKVIPADNAVADGIRETATALKSGRVKISPRCKNWLREASGYVWDEKAGDDRPVKEDDHMMDLVRYFIKTKHIARPRRMPR